MQKNISRLFAGVMVIVLLSFFAIPASAADSGLVGTVQSFVEWSVNKQDDFANSFWKAIFGDSFNAEDFTPGGKYGGGAGREELQAAYDAYVSDLPAGGYTSSGKLLWQPTFSDFDTSSKFGDIYPVRFMVSFLLVRFLMLEMLVKFSSTLRRQVSVFPALEKNLRYLGFLLVLFLLQLMVLIPH